MRKLPVLVLLSVPPLIGLLLQYAGSLIALLSLCLVYGVIVSLDCVTQLHRLQAMIAAGTLRYGLQTPVNGCLTTPGRCIQSLIASVLFCVHRFQDTLFREHICNSSHSPALLPRDEKLVAPADIAADSTWLMKACRACAANGAALIQVDSRSGKLRVSASHAGSRYAAAVERFACALVVSNRRLAGVYEYDSASAAAGSISVFGVAYLYFLPLPAKQYEEYICCLGFDKTSPLDAYQCETVRHDLLQLYREHEQESLQQCVVTAQEAEQATRQFVGYLSHDIRAPLHNVKAALRLISLAGEAAEMQAVALRNCEALEEIVSGILDFTRYNAGRLHSRMESVSINRLVADISKGFMPTAAEQNLILRSTVENKDFHVMADPVQLRRVLNNLVSNALAYTEVGNIQIDARVAGDDMVVISVQDSGLGMTAFEVAQMFEPFCRFQSSTRGTGLGLTVCKILTEANNGTISAASSPGVGTTVTLRFPRVSADVNSSQPGIAADVQRATGTGCPVVLLVDDDPDALAALERALSGYEIVVCNATGVSEARAICTYEPPDIVVTDDAMPEGGGAALAEFLSDGLEAVQTFVLSGSEFCARANMYPTIPAARWFVKPVDPLVLAQRIMEVLNGDRVETPRMLASVA